MEIDQETIKRILEGKEKVTVDCNFNLNQDQWQEIMYNFENAPVDAKIQMLTQGMFNTKVIFKENGHSKEEIVTVRFVPESVVANLLKEIERKAQEIKGNGL